MNEYRINKAAVSGLQSQRLKWYISAILAHVELGKPNSYI